jgi:hypothetical protein
MTPAQCDTRPTSFAETRSGSHRIQVLSASGRAAEQRDELAAVHVWMAPAWQEKM